MNHIEHMVICLPLLMMDSFMNCPEDFFQKRFFMHIFVVFVPFSSVVMTTLNLMIILNLIVIQQFLWSIKVPNPMRQVPSC